jgi:hypothetical protein
MKPYGGPEFPQIIKGMSLRDWFAGQALAGYIASIPIEREVPDARIAKSCYETADAMIKERDRDTTA